MSMLSGCSVQSSLCQPLSWKTFSPEKNSPQIIQIQHNIADYYKSVESTYLTFPEWYIVYSSQEYANYLKDHRPSGFPYFSSIAQYWWSYNTANEFIKNRFPYNIGDHVMLVVIGSSLSAEYFIKGIYENSIGRTTEWLSGNQATAEDIYAQKTAQDYAEFIPIYPWYDFSFSKRLVGLWAGTPFFGPHMLRKLERKVILSVEYGFKSIYASLIALGTHMAYGTTSSDTYALITQIPENFFKEYPNVKNIKSIGSSENIVAIPSEQPFTDEVKKMTTKPIRFKNIAGNNEILVTFVVPKYWNMNFNNSQLLFVMNILTDPQSKRMAVRLPVNSLVEFLQYLQQNNIQIEHIYDY